MSWTDERVAVLSKLWAEGLSASQIAAELGGVTRNAVIGKVHRLGLSGRAKSAATSARTKRPAKPAKTRTPKPAAATPRPTRSVVVPSAPKATVGREKSADIVAPDSLQLSLESLTENTCKWPSGDPSSSDFSFCGVRSEGEGPYCKYHAQLAYQPVADRRRQRKAIEA